MCFREYINSLILGFDDCNLVHIYTLQPNTPIQADYQAQAHNVCLSCVPLQQLPGNYTAQLTQPLIPSKLGRPNMAQQEPDEPRKQF